MVIRIRTIFQSRVTNRAFHNPFTCLSHSRYLVIVHLKRYLSTYFNSIKPVPTIMENIYLTRLKLRQESMMALVEQCKNTIERCSEGVPLQEFTVLKCALDRSIKCFNEEILLFMDKCPQGVKTITEFTKSQFEAEQVLSDSEAMLQCCCSTVNDQVQPSALINTRLPKLNLQKFDGDKLKFYEFYDSFQVNIHNKNLQDVEKLSYLLGCLEGKALETLEGLTVTNSNYQIALDILMKRFGSKSSLINAHYEALNKIEKATVTGECRRTLNNIEKHLRVLQALGEDIENNHLKVIITQKFPDTVLYHVNLLSSENRTVKILKETLDQVITAQERSNFAPLSVQQVTDNIPVSTTEVLHVHTKHNKCKENKPYRQLKRKMPSLQPSNQKKSKLSCIFCKEEHFNDACKKTLNERKSLLKGRCFLCFRLGHRAENCRRRKKCHYCFKWHNRALCPNKSKNIKFYKKSPLNTTVAQLTNIKSFLQTATIKIRSGERVAAARVLLDSGSQRSYITRSLADKLNLCTNTNEEDLLMIYTFGNNTPQETLSPSTEVFIETKRGISKSIRVNIVPQITNSIPVPQFLKNVSCDIPADDGSLGENVDLLIGNDNYFNFIRREKIQVYENLFIVNTDFGWVPSGHVNIKRNDQVLSVITYCQCCEPDCLYYTEPDLPLKDKDLKLLWSLESIGIQDSPKTTKEEEAIKHFNNTVRYENNRYVVKWPWITYPPNLPTNFGLACGRLRSLLNRIDKVTLCEYDNILREQLKSGIIEIIEPHSQILYQTNPPVHYLPHHIVKQEGKSGRIVYDASSKIKEENSLNEGMYRGPCLLEDLTALLLKFRSKKIGVTADVEKAFLQLALQQEDRDVTRFLWVKDIKKPFNEDNILHVRFCRVPFGIISSPFLLAATIRYHISVKHPSLIKTIADKFYVDNLVTGTDSFENTRDLYNQTRKVFQELSMNVREWASNDEKIMKYIQREHQAKDTQNVKVLGLLWKTDRDTLSLRLNENVFNEEAIKNTKNKRDVLRILASFYDPCGFASPVVLPAKLLLRELWLKKFNWDTTLPADIIKAWTSAATNLITAKNVAVPRYVGISTSMPVNIDKYELHCFCDASKDAYAAVVYVRAYNTDELRVELLMSKSRLTPLKERENLQIPRLELLGFLIGCRLLCYVKASLGLPIEKEYLWTDSLIVLSWMKTNKLLPPFVARRVEEIKRAKFEYFYVNTEENPADIATRPEKWHLQQEMWFRGPSFLQQDKALWPQNTNTVTEEVLCLAGEGLVDTQPELDEYQSESHCNEKNIEMSQGDQEPTLDKDMIEIKHLQAEYFSEEASGKKTHLTRNLDLYLDVDGIIRCRGRMANTSWTYEMKHPILIPKECDFTTNLIKVTHEKNYHVGVSHTLSLIRQHYWIPQGRAQVQKVLRRCTSCVKHGGGPYQLPPTPALPAERVNYSDPFTYTGVDYFGPVFVSTGTEREKRWICLFTCLAVRAIQLEVVKDLTAEECLLALRRLIAIRGVPKKIVSDNALYFKLTSEVLTSPYCIDNKIEWKFIPQLAPWHGGVYERLVGLVKSCLKRTLEKHLLKDGQLLTVMKEVEAVVNTRPLTNVGSDLDHVLKPSDFLTLGKCLETTPVNDTTCIRGTTTKLDLIQGWKRGQNILKEFKKMFHHQYLSSLREKHRNHLKQPRVIAYKSPQIGDVVQVKGETKNRNTWKVGKIVSLMKGSDGAYRVAKVRVGHEELTRSIGHLYPLEMEDNDPGGTCVKESDVRTPQIETRTEPEVLTVYKDVEPENMYINELIERSNESDDRVTGRRVESEDETLINDKDTENEIISVQQEAPIHDRELISEANEPEIEERVKRGAAIRAREKIAEWTRNLVALL